VNDDLEADLVRLFEEDTPLTTQTLHTTEEE